MKGEECLGFEDQNRDGGVILSEWHEEGQIKRSCSNTGSRNGSHNDWLMPKEEKINPLELKATEKSEAGESRAPTRLVNPMADDSQIALHAAVSKEHLKLVKNLLEGGANVNKQDARGKTPKALSEH